MTQLSLTFRNWQLMTGAVGRCLAFDLTIENTAKRSVGFLSYEFELWQVNQQKTLQADTQAYRVTPLGSDIRGRITEAGAQTIPEMTNENQKSSFRLLWHYTPEQLQEIEDYRAGKEPIFEIRGNIQTFSRVAPTFGAVTNNTQCETPLWPDNGHFLQVRFSHSDWDKLLNDIGFRHPVIDRLRWPNLPPAFQQSERNLIDAWKHYRAGLPHECLSACYKAFECLGFNLFADEKLQRQKLIDALMVNAPLEIREAALDILKGLQTYYQHGRHERKARVKLDQNDAQMAVLTATALRAYLAPHYISPKL